MSRERARCIAQAALERGRPLDWFEELYSEAAVAGLSALPWADLEPNPHLLEWLDRERVEGAGKSALVVGCGLGDDAEELGRRGFAVTAFDISESAIRIARRRFPASPVEYLSADLFRLPEGWTHGFDFVYEAYTLQVLPASMRDRAARRIALLVAPGGTLLLIARGKDADEEEDQLPWPLTRTQAELPLECGLDELLFEDYLDTEDPPVRRFRAAFRFR